MAGRYSSTTSNYVLKKTHQYTKKGKIILRDWVTIGGQHQIEKGKRQYYSDTNFLFTDNLYPTTKKRYNNGKWVAHWTYEDVKNAEATANNVVVNNTSNDIRDFAYYGSAVELVKSSILNIINWFPARVTVSGETIYNEIGDEGFEVVNGYYILDNPFEVDFVHRLNGKDKENYNVDRFLANSYADYTVNGEEITSYSVVTRRLMSKVTGGVEYIQAYTDAEQKTKLSDGWTYHKCKVSDWLPISNKSGGNNNALYTVTINGKYVLQGFIYTNREVTLVTNNSIVIRPKIEQLDDYFANLDGFEKQLLNLTTKPHYKNSFLTPIAGNLSYRYVYRDYIWPSDYDDELGYSFIDITNQNYNSYVDSLVSMATIFDEEWCDNLYRNMTHESIKNFDWTYTKDYVEGDEQDNIDGGNRVMNLLRIYGRCFDDLKRLSDGIGFVAKNTYDGYSNQPDAEISDRLEYMGWDITSTIPVFTDSNQGYVNIVTGVLTNKETYDTFDSSVKPKYELAYINDDTAFIIGKTEYDALSTDAKKLYDAFYPSLDLNELYIDSNFANSFGKKDSSKHLSWFNSSNPEYYTSAISDVEFVRRLTLSSAEIMRTKGTKHAIDMVMGMFGFGEDDYAFTEKYYYTMPKSYDASFETVEEINYYKNYPRYYDDEYSGVLLKDVFIGNGHYIVPYNTSDRTYDGDVIFESNGGWGNDENGKYMETISYLHVVSKFSELLDVNPNSLAGGDIYYVIDVSSYSDYSSDKVMSHFFHLVEYGEYSPQLTENWENVNLELNDEVSKKAKYLDGIISSNFGNNPHVGYGRYDDGGEYKKYLEKPFKYSIDNNLLPNEQLDMAKGFTYDIKDGEDNEKLKVLINDDGSKYYINRKWFQIENKINSDLYKEYFRETILPYVMQVIPSTTILILKNFD